MAEKLKGKIVTPAKRNKEEKMTVAELMHHNFDEIFIELDPVKREAMMRNACKSIFAAMPAVSAARVVPRNLRRLMLPGAIKSSVIISPSAQPFIVGSR